MEAARKTSKSSVASIQSVGLSVSLSDAASDVELLGRRREDQTQDLVEIDRSQDLGEIDRRPPAGAFRASQIVPIRNFGSQSDPARRYGVPSSEQFEPHQPGWFCVVSLNIGGRNTNSLEFVLDGDDTDTGAEHASVMARMVEVMQIDTFGPGSLSAAERKEVDSLLSELEGSEVRKQLAEPTWARVYEAVRRDSPGLFNTLNLATLRLGRPSALEAPALG
jgi:hypothetical protein